VPKEQKQSYQQAARQRSNQQPSSGGNAYQEQARAANRKDSATDAATHGDSAHIDFGRTVHAVIVDPEWNDLAE